MIRAAACLLALGTMGTGQSEVLFLENAEGLIVIEAEHFHDKADKDGPKWVEVKEPAGFAGHGGMEAKPNDGVNQNEDFVTLSPRLDYKIKPAKPGTFRVWVRGRGPADSDNSCHVGLNGAAVDSSDRIGDFPVGEWAWHNDTHDGEPAVIELKAAGTSTLNVWMREDGFIIDKIILARDDKYQPKEEGPPDTLQ